MAGKHATAVAQPSTALQANSVVALLFAAYALLRGYAWLAFASMCATILLALWLLGRGASAGTGGRLSPDLDLERRRVHLLQVQRPPDPLRRDRHLNLLGGGA